MLGLDSRFREGLRPSPLYWVGQVGAGCSGAGKRDRPKVWGPVQNGERDSSPPSGPFFQDLRDLRDRLVADIQGTDGDTEAQHGSQCRGPLVVTAEPGWPEEP